MRNYTADGRLKLRVEQDTDAAATPTVLAIGSAAPIALDADGFATLQALSVTADTDGLALSQAPSSGVGLTLISGSNDLRPPRKVTLTSVANLSGITFVVIGLDIFGADLSESIVGPNNTTVTGSSVFASVTSITPSASNAGMVLAGWPTSDTPYRIKLDVTTADPSRPITIVSASNLSAVTFTIVGLDTDGDAQTETLVGPNNGTAVSLGYYSSITSVTPGTLGSGSASLGWPATAAVLYEATNDTVISHVIFKNNNAATQTGEFVLVVGAGVAPLRNFELEEDESGSLLAYEPNLPIPAGAQLRMITTTSGAVSYTIHGTVG